MTLTPSLPRRRRTYTDAFKADAVAACQVPGVSISAIALARQLNANLLRRWLQEARGGERAAPRMIEKPLPKRLHPPATPPALVPVTVQAVVAPLHPDIRIEVQRAGATINISWPVAQAAECAQWLREVLR